jgi:hypothetical protein
VSVETSEIVQQQNNVLLLPRYVDTELKARFLTRGESAWVIVRDMHQGTYYVQDVPSLTHNGSSTGRICIGDDTTPTNYPFEILAVIANEDAAKQLAEQRPLRQLPAGTVVYDSVNVERRND